MSLRPPKLADMLRGLGDANLLDETAPASAVQHQLVQFGESEDVKRPNASPVDPRVEAMARIDSLETTHG